MVFDVDLNLNSYLPRMFQRLYDSPWHNPVLFLVVAALFLLVLLGRRASTFLWRWAALFTLEIAADAYVTGGWSPLLPNHASLIGTVAVPFVILGDYRFFLLAERVRAAAEPFAPTPRRAFGIALAWSFVVPVLAFGTARIVPALFVDSRRLFLLYEAMFLVLAAAYYATRLRSLADSEAARWLRKLFAFEIVTYVLWALADIVILGGSDVGYGIRLAPNVFYYACFLPFAYLTAPRAWRA